ncbi:MAG: methyltransferase domain-containing protein [Chloroflexi bacterium]|uniref:Class I SAM-dependent methyltransferase n=1 Tax=Candidatus Chlorohelix allophototropha TaxID=3003348 RepID=A0A8T7M7C7_9CHLR|nr:methyltransferase domain-containing protein [Chloroflexota bacterium]WJW69817.1 class I SAM-dependent methyltransferase [Chloroflexota bacterium L227-S17]
MLTLEELAQRNVAIVEKYGPWTHNIYLGEGFYTLSDGLEHADYRVKLFLRIVSDLAGKPLNTLRVLDLACLNGIYGLEFAMHGAQVVGIEGREANLVKAQFAKDTLGLDNIELVVDDVRNLSREKYGLFDVVICSGIVYHLDTPDVFGFIEKIGEVCTGLTIVDGHISFTPNEKREYKGETYWGRSYREHVPGATAEEIEKNLLASLDNSSSFWLTLLSLNNLLARSGFTSVYECHYPVRIERYRDRVTLVAMKGKPLHLQTTPLLNDTPEQFYPRQLPDIAHPSQQSAYTEIAVGQELGSLLKQLEDSPDRTVVTLAQLSGKLVDAKDYWQSEAERLRLEFFKLQSYTRDLEQEWNAKNRRIDALETRLNQQSLRARLSTLVSKLRGR